MAQYIFENILFYFLPLAIPSTVAIFTSEKIRAKKRVILWGNLIVLLFIIVYSIFTIPGEMPLNVELAFYSLHEGTDSTYELNSLINKGAPEFLGLENNLSEIKGVPVVCSGDHAQIRIKLNQRGYVYVFHFDTTFTNIRQLFPSKDIQHSNPVFSYGWLELPSTEETWKFDQDPGFEFFIIYVSIRKSDDIKGRIRKIVQDIKESSVGIAIKLENLKQCITILGSHYPIRPGEFAHNLTGVIPPIVKTYSYQARNGKSILLCQFVQHEP